MLPASIKTGMCAIGHQPALETGPVQCAGQSSILRSGHPSSYQATLPCRCCATRVASTSRPTGGRARWMGAWATAVRQGWPPASWLLPPRRQLPARQRLRPASAKPRQLQQVLQQLVSTCLGKGLSCRSFCKRGCHTASSRSSLVEGSEFCFSLHVIDLSVRI